MRPALATLALVFAAAACGQCGARAPVEVKAAPGTVAAPVAPPAFDPWAPVPPAVAEAMKLRAGHPQQALKALQRVWAAAIDGGDARTAAMALHRSGDVSNDVLEFADARTYYLRALGLYELVGDQALIGQVTNDLGLGARVGLVDGRPWFRYAVATRRDAGDLKGLRTSLGNLGARLVISGQLTEAVRVLEESRALAEQLGDLEGQRKAHLNLAGAWSLIANDPGSRAWSPDAGLGPRTIAFEHLRQGMELGARLGLDPYRAACDQLIPEARPLCADLDHPALPDDGLDDDAGP